jgi:hypothetical protein
MPFLNATGSAAVGLLNGHNTLVVIPNLPTAKRDEPGPTVV